MAWRKQLKVWKVLAVLCAAAVFSGCASETAVTLVDSPSGSDDNWEMVSDATLVLDNGVCRFEMDTQTTHFSVTNLATGHRYTSVPETPVSAFTPEDEGRLSSELTITYYGEQTTALYMCSAYDSVSAGNVEIRTNGEAVRVYYTMGAMDQLTPAVLDTATFDSILASLASDSMRRRVQRYYTLYSAENPPDDFATQAEAYPIIKEQPLYLISETLSDIEKGEIGGYMEDAGFTLEKYEAMLAALNISGLETEKPAGFVIPVEYRLEADGFSAAVLSDRIEESSGDYKLQSVDLLEYFASSGAESQGAFVVPDGAGALVNFNSARSLTYTKPFYGNDTAVQSKGIDELSRTLSLPIFGISTEEGGLLAVVESAAEVAQLHVNPLGDSSPQNHIYASFTMRALDVTDIGKEMQIPIFNLFSANRLVQSPRVRYILMAADAASYADMAARYRRYLQEKGTLGTEPTDGEQTVYLDFLCMITENASMMGVPYTRKIVLSTLAEITDVVRRMQEAGVERIAVRLLGYGPGGLEHGVYNTFALDKRVGTLRELKALAALLKTGGGSLYLDADIQFSAGTQNGFTPSDDGAHYLNRRLVRSVQHNVVTRQYDDDGLSFYAVSPLRYAAYAERFAASLKKAWGEDTLPGLSYGSSGLYLGGDYSPRRSIDRVTAAGYLSQTLETVLESTGNAGFLFDNGNAYVLPYASAVLNLPLTSSGEDIEAQTIPLYAMVLHGYLPYAGTPWNLAANPEEERLRAVQFGASPYAAFVTRDDALLSNTVYESQWYSLSGDERLDQMLRWIQDTAAARTAASGALTAYETVSDTVSLAVYESGAKIYVNYGEQDATVNGLTVPAHDYALLR